MLKLKRLLRLSVALFLLFGTIAVSWSFAKADVTSCSASVDPHAVNPSATVDLSFQIDNTDTVPITWVRITRPSTNFTIIANSSSGWQSTTSSSYAFQTNGVLNPGETMFVSVTAQIGPTEASSANWTVQTSEQPGVNIFACSGDLGTSIEGTILDTTPPDINNVSVSDVTSSSAVVSWTTDEPATSQVNYGLSSGYGQSTNLDNNLTTSHSASLTGLSASTGYHFQVRSSDASSNTAYSSDNTFVTTASSGGSSGGGSSSGSGSSSDPGSFAKTKIPLNSTPTETTPPTVSIDTDLSKPFTQSPEIEGEVTDNDRIAGVEYSIDGGQNWILVDADSGLGTNKASFSFTPLNLDDGNYSIKVRAIDVSGNVGQSDTYNLVIDRLPPITGGAVLSMGPQIMNPDDKGVVYSVAGIDQKITLSAVGGPTSIKALAKSVEKGTVLESFNLTQMQDTGLWTGVISFKEPGTYNLVVESVDGAGRKTSKVINDIYVAPKSKVVSKDSEEPISSSIEVFYLEPESNRWTLWDGGSYGQPNPQITDPLGGFKLFLPEGRYYLEVKSKGFKKLTTDIFEVDESRPISADLQLSKKLGFEVGKIEFAIPIWSTNKINTDFQVSLPDNFVSSQKLAGSSLPEFSLTNTAGDNITPIELLGRPTVLTVMNTWSPESSRQAKVLSELQKNQDINIVPVALQEKAGRVGSFNSISGYDVIWLIDSDSALGSLLGPNGVPAHYFVDRRGTVKEIKYGFMDEKSIENNLGGL